VYAFNALLNKPLTYNASPFSIASLIVMLYSIRVFAYPDWCWDINEVVGAQIPRGAPYDKSAVPNNDFPGAHPGVWLQSPPGQSAQPTPPPVYHAPPSAYPLPPAPSAYPLPAPPQPPPTPSAPQAAYPQAAYPLSAHARANAHQQMDPRSFYGELGNTGGKRVVPFTSNRGYGHYVSTPL
jgi:hypothetical protein